MYRTNPKGCPKRRAIKQMKIMIASDIHGSALYCEKMLDAYRRKAAEKLLLLGDILYHGPRNDLPQGYAPKEVIALLNPMKQDLLCVRGNCDTEVDQMVLEFPILSDSCLLYLDGWTIFATHGHHLNPQTPPMLKKGDILLSGHTHVPKCQRCGDFIYLNPGSVSIPKEGSAHGYLLWEDGNLLFKNLEGEIWRSVPAGELLAMRA